MPSLASARCYIPILAATAAGFSTAFVLFRKNPLAALLSFSGGDFNSMAALLIVGAPILLIASTKTVPFPDRWGLFAFFGIGWAAVSVGVNQGIESVTAPLVAMVMLALGAIISFFVPSGGKKLLLWGPSALFLVHQFVTTLFQGPLPGGFFGQGTGSIAFGHLMAVGFLLSYLASLNFAQHANLCFAVSGVFMVGVMLSGSRGALFGLLVGLSLIQLGILFEKSVRAVLHELKKISFLLILTVFPFFLPPSLLPNQQRTPIIQRKLTQTFEQSEEYGSFHVQIYTAGRLEIWAETFGKFKSPLDAIIGTGHSSIETAFGVTYPHNLFLELLLIGGLLSLVPFFLFLIGVFRKTFGQGIMNGFEFFILAATVGVFSMFSGDLTYNAIFFYLLGLAYGQILKKAGSSRRSTR